MFHFDDWGTVNYGGRSLDKVVCRQLGYNTFSKKNKTAFKPMINISSSSLDASSLCCATFGEGRGTIYRVLGCSKYEYRVGKCDVDTITDRAYHSSDWSVSCDIGKVIICTLYVVHTHYYCVDML